MPDAADPSMPHRGLSALVVEDEFLIAMDIEFMLEDQGHRVTGRAASVEEALLLLEGQRPDIAILDVNLRGRFITPVAERLRELDIPFVLSSAYTSMDFIGSPALMEAPIVAKPADEWRLAEAVRIAMVKREPRASVRAPPAPCRHPAPRR